MKKFLMVIIVCILSCQIGITAVAGQWKSDTLGWWYDNGNGTYPINSWQWIDGNNDSVAECYYFDSSGYCLQNGITPDGFQVNVDGAWIKDGNVQIQQADSKNINSQDELYILSEKQTKIIEKILSNITCFNSNMDSLDMKDLTTDDISYLIANIMNDEMYLDDTQEDSFLIFDKYVINHIIESNQYVRHFDKQDVFKKMEDIYGHHIVESMITNTLDIVGQTIFIGGGAGDCAVLPNIIDYKIKNDKLYLTFSYKVSYVVPELDTAGTALAIFRKNPDSFIGFTLEHMEKVVLSDN